MGPVHRLVAGLLLSAVSAAPALAADWVIAQVTGEAWIAPKNAPAMRAAAGMTIPDEATFTTARNARAKLGRGQETILVSPSTVLSPDTSFLGWTTIEQRAGKIILNVEKRNVQHLSVETPFLTAVVKGTQFTVSVSPDRADVKVSRGLVGVTDFRTGQSADVAPGQNAAVSVNGSGGLQVGGAGKAPEVQQGQPRTAQVEIVDPAASRAKAAESAANASADQNATGRSDEKGASGKGGGGSAAGSSGSNGSGSSGNGNGGGSNGSGGNDGGGGNGGSGGDGSGGGNGGNDGGNGGGNSGGNGGGNNGGNGGGGGGGKGKH